MEYYGNRLCISMRDLVDSGIMSESNYKQLVRRGRIEVARRGGGSKGSYAMVVVESLPERFRAKLETIYPVGVIPRLEEWIMTNYERDQKAAIFFYDPRKCGRILSAEKINEYTVNASVLNTCIKLYDRTVIAKKFFGDKYDWTMLATVIDILRMRLGHTLPVSTPRFRKKVNDYKVKGYVCLISGKFGNQSARKYHKKEEKN